MPSSTTETAETTKTADAVAREVTDMSVKEAEATIIAAGFTSRVVVIHGAGIPGITNASTTRIKLWVENDKVYRAQVG